MKDYKVVYQCEYMKRTETGYHCPYRDEYAEWVGSHITRDSDIQPVVAVLGLICPKRPTFLSEQVTCIVFEREGEYDRERYPKRNLD